MNGAIYVRRRGSQNACMDGGPKVRAVGVLQQREDATKRPSVLPADVQQVVVIKEEVLWSQSLDPDHRHIKEEQEEVWTNDNEEQDIIRFPFIAVQVKSEDDEDYPQSQTEGSIQEEPSSTSSCKLMKTETDEEDSGGPEPARNLDPNHHIHPNTAEKASYDCETEGSFDDGDWQEPFSVSGPSTEDSDSGWKETGMPELSANTLEKEDFHQTQATVQPEKTSSTFLIGETSLCLEQNVDSQMKIHMGEKPFGCGICGKTFSRKTLFKSHMRGHTGEKPYGCDACGKRFTLQYSFKRHMRVHTGEKQFGCDDCGKTFRCKTHLKRHMRVHTGERPFGCTVCGERFTEQGALKRHTRVHTGERPFGCTVCGERFAEQGVLKRHIRVHTGEKPFSCDVCGKKFRQQNTLKRHMNVHTGEKPYGCSVCGKTFREQTTLKRHTVVHTGEKPFCCGVCGERFTRQGNLKRHMKGHP